MSSLSNPSQVSFEQQRQECGVPNLLLPPMKSLTISELIKRQDEAQNDDFSDDMSTSDGRGCDQREDKEYVLAMREAIDFAATKKFMAESDVEASLSRFRKVVGGLEKYRITNPGMVADHYRDMIRTCLAIEDTWGRPRWR